MIHARVDRESLDEYPLAHVMQTSLTNLERVLDFMNASRLCHIPRWVWA